MKIVGFIIVTTGLAYAVKQIMHKKEYRSGLHKIKVEDEKELVQGMVLIRSNTESNILTKLLLLF